MTIRLRSFVALAVVLGTLHARAAPRAQALEGLVNIRFQLDPRVFGVMAAANAAGFDLDAGEVAPGSVRARVRERLTRLDPGLRARLGEFYAARDPEHDPLRQQSKYVSFALLVGVEAGGGTHVEVHIQLAAAGTAQVGDALATVAEAGAALHPGRSLN